jgi:hypothetical protein
MITVSGDRSLHTVYMYWNITLYTINICNYYVLSKNKNIKNKFPKKISRRSNTMYKGDGRILVEKNSIEIQSFCPC